MKVKKERSMDSKINKVLPSVSRNIFQFFTIKELSKLSQVSKKKEETG